MGCDIHTATERKVDGEWQIMDFRPFDHRTYRVFGFLADVRNYSGVPSISKPRGVPGDSPFANKINEDGEYTLGDIWLGDHSFSWLSITELNAFNYDAEIEDRRVTRKLPNGIISGGETCEPGEGEKTTWREFLGSQFFEDLKKLNEIGAERIVFGFDS